MARGGPRPGSGRPKGTLNKRNAELQAKVEAEGITPLQYMLNRMRDEKLAEEERFRAAQAAAPYVHAKLSAVDANVTAEFTLGDILDAVST